MKASIKLFAEKGFAGTSIREITYEAGVNSALIGFHFGGKDGLYLEALHVAGRMVEKMVWTLPQLPDLEEPDARVRAWSALRAFTEMILRTSRPCSSAGTLEQRRDGGRWVAAFLTREMIRPQSGAETNKAEALRPAVVYLEECIRGLRPDLDEAGRAWLALSLQGLLLLVSNPGLASTQQSSTMLHLDLDSLTSHIMNTALAGCTHNQHLHQPGCPFEEDS